MNHRRAALMQFAGKCLLRTAVPCNPTQGKPHWACCLSRRRPTPTYHSTRGACVDGVRLLTESVRHHLVPAPLAGALQNGSEHRKTSGEARAILELVLEQQVDELSLGAARSTSISPAPTPVLRLLLMQTQKVAFLSTSRAPPPPCYGTTIGPLRFYPLHDPRLAMPLRKEPWLHRVCGSPCQKVP